MTIVPYEVVEGPNDGDVRVKAEGKEYAPPEISAMILQKLKADAEAYLGEPVTDAVVTVPAYFNNGVAEATKAGKDRRPQRPSRYQRADRRRAGRARQGGPEHTILVFDLGAARSTSPVPSSVTTARAAASTTSRPRTATTTSAGTTSTRRSSTWMIAEFKRDQGIDLGQDPMALSACTSR